MVARVGVGFCIDGTAFIKLLLVDLSTNRSLFTNSRSLSCHCFFVLQLAICHWLKNRTLFCRYLLITLP